MPRGQVEWSDESATSNNVTRHSASQSGAGSSSGATISRNNEANSNCGAFRLGVYGWRKRCLYTLVLLLMVMVILNLALTLWLIKVMEFSSEGIGSLRVVPGGVELRGQADILDTLVASSVRSRRGRNLILESWSNFTASARAHDGRLLARFTLGEDRLDCVSKGFRITDPRGGVLFSADRERVVVGAEVLHVTGVGGAVFQGSVQTPLVRAESGRDLSGAKPASFHPQTRMETSRLPVSGFHPRLRMETRWFRSAVVKNRLRLGDQLHTRRATGRFLARLESATRSLEIRAPQGITIESRAGDVTASCLSDMKLQSIAGAVRIDAASVFLKGLRTAVPGQIRSSRDQHPANSQYPAFPGRSTRQSSNKITVYQLCACASGKLFLARPDSACHADDAVCR